jgi:hypothetical protein
MLVLVSDVRSNGLDVVHTGDTGADEPRAVCLEERLRREFLSNPASICAPHGASPGGPIRGLRLRRVTPQSFSTPFCGVDEEDGSDPDDQAVLNEAATITQHVSRVVFPAFSLDRGEGCEVHENAYRDLQTYLGLRERLAANEGARSFTYESTRERTPLGHSHREHIRDRSIAEIREMYRQAVNRLLSEVAETEEFFRAGIVAIDITEADPFTGDRTGHEDEITGTKEKTDEYAYQWATVQLVDNAADCAGRETSSEGESRLEIVEELLDSAEERVHVDNVLMDREFDSQHVLEMLSQRGLSYVVPKRMQTSEKPKRSGCSSETKTGMKPTANCMSARTNGTRRPDLSAERELRAQRPPAVFGVHVESRKRIPHGVRLPLGDREWLQVDQAIHCRDDVEAFRAPILLRRVRVSAVLDLASGGSPCAG